MLYRPSVSSRSGVPLHLRSFPTRRSSDLDDSLREIDGAMDFQPLAVPQRWHGLEVLLELIDDFLDRKSTRLNSSHLGISYAVFCLKKKRCPCIHEKWSDGRSPSPPLDTLP